VVKVAGAIHGFLFIVYLLLILDLTRRTRLPLLHMLLTMAAGLVPGATFYAEWRTRHWVQAHFATELGLNRAAASAADGGDKGSGSDSQGRITTIV